VFTARLELLMRCRVPLVLVAVLFMCSQSGCAMLLFPIRSEQSALDLRQGTPVPGPDNLHGLEPGKHGELLVSSLPSEDPSGNRRTTIAGQIVAVSENEIVLTDCIRFEEQVQPAHERPFSRVPYLNRLYKVTGVEYKSNPVPGEVRIPKSSILAATVISETNWPAYREGPHFERVGIDFDFNVPSVTDAPGAPG
jgi:hypothetical protein